MFTYSRCVAFSLFTKKAKTGISSALRSSAYRIPIYLTLLPLFSLCLRQQSWIVLILNIQAEQKEKKKKTQKNKHSASFLPLTALDFQRHWEHQQPAQKARICFADSSGNLYRWFKRLVFCFEVFKIKFIFQKTEVIFSTELSV